MTMKHLVVHGIQVDVLLGNMELEWLQENVDFGGYLES